MLSGEIYSMTESYLDSKRISGTTADREGTPAVAGGWKELGRHTLGSALDVIDVTSLADKRYYMFLLDAQPTGVIDSGYRLNTDAGSNYVWRQSTDGAGDTTDVNSNNINGDAGSPSGSSFSVGYVANLSAKEKLLMSHNTSFSTAGAGTAPNRMETVGKHAQTSNPVTAIGSTNFGAGSYNTGAELVVLGWDPADTHTSNFWEELDDVSWTSGTGITTSAFTAKKYMWFQGYIVSGAAGSNMSMRVGNTTIDTGSNYALRESENGATDGTLTSTSVALNHNTPSIDNGEIGFVNGFVINNSANEKLMIIHSSSSNTAGAATSPDRVETVTKWANTSAQMNILQLFTSAGTGNPTAGQIKVWGSD